MNFKNQLNFNFHLQRHSAGIVTDMN